MTDMCTFPEIPADEVSGSIRFDYFYSNVCDIKLNQGFDKYFLMTGIFLTTF